MEGKCKVESHFSMACCRKKKVDCKPESAVRGGAMIFAEAGDIAADQGMVSVK